MLGILSRPAMAIILVGLTFGAFGTPRPASADSIDTASLLFDGHNTLFRAPFGAVTSGTPVTVRFRTAHAGATAVTAYFERADRTTPPPTQVPMTLDSAHSTAQYDFWQATLTPSAVGIWGFRFLVQNGTAQTWYEDQQLPLGAAGVAVSGGNRARDYLISAYQPGFTVPSWLKNAVMYQIFPDRFYNGDKKNDTKVLNPAYDFNATIIKKWTDPEPTTADYNQLNYYGGDLQGIIDKLPYLKGLGVNVLYLNPIFESGTNHGYDTADYMKIAAHFGTLKTFKTLIAKAHKAHMKVILDGVFNHTSSDSTYFNKYGHFQNSGAYQSQTSPYFGWYTFQQWPARYQSYFGIDTLPELNESDAVKNFIYRGSSSVAQYWLKQGADGWRLDHAVGKSDAWWQDFRAQVKGQFPNDAMICECDNPLPFGGVDNLLGNLFDGDMNYPFRSNVLTFYARGNGGYLPSGFTATQFLNAMLHIAEIMPRPAAYASMNVVGTHDTDRTLDLVHGSIPEMKQIAALQMTWLGMPEIYYGDEAGLTGAGSPDTIKRKPFPWSNPNKSLQAFYRKVIHLRTANPALRDGSVSPLLSDDANRVFAFLRQDSKQAVPVVVNDGAASQSVSIPTTGIKKGASLVDGISGKKYKVTGATLSVKVAGTSTAILVPSKK